MIPPKTVEIWLSRLTGAALGAECLSEEERKRAAAFRFARDRDRFLEGRVLLRRQLSQYLALPPEAHCFEIGTFGKPFLIGSALHFNVSHAGQLFAVAFAVDAEIGLDIEEFPLRHGAPLELARAVCSPAELQHLRDSPPGEQEALFLRYWTAKEAFLKALGTGFQLAPERIEIVGDDASGWTVRTDLPGVDTSAWNLQPLSVAGGGGFLAMPAGWRAYLQDGPGEASRRAFLGFSQQL